MKMSNQKTWKESLAKHEPKDPRLQQAFRMIAEHALLSEQVVAKACKEMGLPDPEFLKSHEEHVSVIGRSLMGSADEMMYGILFYVEKTLREKK
jgi:hypothetical protein